ncbi:MAG: hypothetical protein VKL41_21950 [Snowella sp.]|nr:hypothetical protein [Snowella sp.]
MIPYTTEKELENIIYRDIFAEAESHADMRNCFIEVNMNSLDDPERRW